VHGSHGATLALRDGERGLLVKCFAGCDARDVFAELRWRGLLGNAPHARCHRQARAIVPPDNRHDAVHRIALARRIWNAARDARGSPVVSYLASRGITIPLPPSLRWAPALRRLDGTNGPAMVARIDSIDGELIGIARTWIAHDPAGSWCRIDRAMLGRATGGAVRFASTAKTLLIGEGIETTLAGIEATGLPGWAALSTSGMVGLILPPVARKIVILADHDANGAGERAARIAETYWRREGRRVSVWMSRRPGEDANDLLRAAVALEARDVAA
jgi:hypothetical protein